MKRPKRTHVAGRWCRLRARRHLFWTRLATNEKATSRLHTVHRQALSLATSSKCNGAYTREPNPSEKKGDKKGHQNPMTWHQAFIILAGRTCASKRHFTSLLRSWQPHRESWVKAQPKAVRPAWSCTSKGWPAAMRACTTSRWPWSAATCKGLLPSLRSGSGFAPVSTNVLTMSAYPLQAARQIAVSWSSSVLLLISSLVTCGQLSKNLTRLWLPLMHAVCKGDKSLACKDDEGLTPDHQDLGISDVGILVTICGACISTHRFGSRVYVQLRVRGVANPTPPHVQSECLLTGAVVCVFAAYYVFLQCPKVT